MEQFARKEYDLILPWKDGLITAFADVCSLFQSRVVNSQFPAFELPRLTMKKVNKRQMTGRDSITPVVAVEAEEVPVITCRNLHLRVGDAKLLHA